MHFYFVIDVCLFHVTLFSNITLAHSWYCRWYWCLKHQPVALEVRHRGEIALVCTAINIYSTVRYRTSCFCLLERPPFDDKDGTRSHTTSSEVIARHKQHYATKKLLQGTDSTTPLRSYCKAQTALRN